MFGATNSTAMLRCLIITTLTALVFGIDRAQVHMLTTVTPEAKDLVVGSTGERMLVDYFPICAQDSALSTCSGLFSIITDPNAAHTCEAYSDVGKCYFCGGNSLPDFRRMLLEQCMRELGFFYCSLGDIVTTTDDNGDTAQVRTTSCCYGTGGCVKVLEYATQGCYHDLPDFGDGTTTYPICAFFLEAFCEAGSAEAQQCSTITAAPSGSNPTQPTIVSPSTSPPSNPTQPTIVSPSTRPPASGASGIWHIQRGGKLSASMYIWIFSAAIAGYQTLL